ncbi:MAG: class II histone deacetylase [Pseudomonadota bacterium]|nr:class II histone deacetylase [Pseudomonadota bacterium]
MNKTGFFSHEECFWHSGADFALTVPVGGSVQPLYSNGFPENPETKRRLINLIDISGLSKEITRLSANRASENDLLSVHTEKYINKFKKKSKMGGGQLGSLAPFGLGGFEISCRSAGLAITAVDQVLRGHLDNAYALSRPPGHHCLPDFPNGFCLLNNIAIAVRAAQAKGLAKKFAIIDWDVHHGNGTEAIFYSDPNVLTISIHQDRNYPWDTGSYRDRGKGHGEGFNVNIPLPPGSGDWVYRYALSKIAIPVVESFKPDILIVACGFDASGVDPLSRMLCGSGTFREMTKLVMSLADSVCAGKLVLVHEGGYSEVHVPFCGHSVVEQLVGSAIKLTDPLEARIRAQQPSDDFNRFVSKKIHEIRVNVFR